MRAHGVWKDVSQKLQADIYSGRLRPCEHLTEDDVIERTGASRHAVRKAFDDLVSLDWQTRRPITPHGCRDIPARKFVICTRCARFWSSRRRPGFRCQPHPILSTRLSGLKPTTRPATRPRVLTGCSMQTSGFTAPCFRPAATPHGATPSRPMPAKHCPSGCGSLRIGGLLPTLAKTTTR